MSDIRERVDEMVKERNAILRSLDVEGAKAFIPKYGGKLPGGRLDWLKVLHLARFDCMSMTGDERQESQIFLARNGAEQIATLSPTSAYLHAAMDLLMPTSLVMEMMTNVDTGVSL